MLKYDLSSYLAVPCAFHSFLLMWILKSIILHSFNCSFVYSVWIRVKGRFSGFLHLAEISCMPILSTITFLQGSKLLSHLRRLEFIIQPQPWPLLQLVIRFCDTVLCYCGKTTGVINSLNVQLIGIPTFGSLDIIEGVHWGWSECKYKRGLEYFRVVYALVKSIQEMFTGHLILKTFKLIEERCRFARLWWFQLHFARLDFVFAVFPFWGQDQNRWHVVFFSIFCPILYQVLVARVVSDIVIGTRKLHIFYCYFWKLM